MDSSEGVSPVMDCMAKIVERLDMAPGRISYHEYEPEVPGVAESTLGKVFGFTGYDPAIIEDALELLEGERVIDRSRELSKRDWTPTGSKGQPNSRQFICEVVRA